MTVLQWVGLAIVASPFVVIWAIAGRTMGYLRVTILYAAVACAMALLLVGIQLMKYGSLR